MYLFDITEIFLFSIKSTTSPPPPAVRDGHHLWRISSSYSCLRYNVYVGCLQNSSHAYGVVPAPRDGEEKEMMHRMLRVDHAGEYGANRIYAGQMAVLGRSRTGPLIQVNMP